MSETCPYCAEWRSDCNKHLDRIAALEAENAQLKSGDNDEMTELAAKLANANRRIAALEADNKSMKSELAKWERPFDAERLAEAEKQASHKDSLAAMGIYNDRVEGRAAALSRRVTSHDGLCRATHKARHTTKE